LTEKCGNPTSNKGEKKWGKEKEGKGREKPSPQNLFQGRSFFRPVPSHPPVPQINFWLGFGMQPNI